MRKLISLCLGLLCLISAFAADTPALNRQSYKIYVDKNGVMRRSDTKEEVSYYGTNYTLPFAHAYRAVGSLGLDRKEAIDKDVYHMKRLGFNGFRLHLWDVEIADSAGNLLRNDHLDLLDYLINKLEQEGIDIVLTAQTNFGNGYPEKNIDTGSFSYEFDKCAIHSDKTAQEIQANYLTQLASHVNPYTGKSYSDDNAIIAIEINNEPCHTASAKEVTAYINKMVKALKKGGFDKPVLYNVSHNPDVTEAYYDANIQGTTYQWYPTGLVAGHQRKGNFLPYVDDYNIPWKDTIKNYNKLARVVYEFDPGDVLYSYLYPAIARTFRKEGFQWITQFAYDPIDIAKYNTEYQTHFLNLAYTPAKAISMMIAAEAARNIPRGADFGSFPTDTVFGDFTVSYADDLSLYNSGEKYYHSNSTSVAPGDIEKLKNIAGTGLSPVVDYTGTGAYFLDEVNPGVWRLELMPDVAITSDPFEKPSLNKEVAEIFYAERPMKINLPQLGKSFFYEGINEGNNCEGRANDSEFTAYPGVYLLSPDNNLITEFIHNNSLPHLTTFIAPAQSGRNSIVIHNPATYIGSQGDVEISAEIIGASKPEKVMIYPDYVSFWNDNNFIVEMENVGGNLYKGTIPSKMTGNGDSFNYNIVVIENGDSFTWPQNVKGNPLDWDFTDYEYFSSQKIDNDQPIVLLAPREKDNNLEVAMIPEAWNFNFTPSLKYPVNKNSYDLISIPDNEGKLIIRRYIGDELRNAPFLSGKQNIVVKLWPEIIDGNATIGFLTKNGATYTVNLSPRYLEEMPVKLHVDNPASLEYRIPITDLTQDTTNIIPAGYPSFLSREAKVGEMPFTIEDIEFVELTYPTKKGQLIKSSIEGIWLE